MPKEGGMCVCLCIMLEYQYKQLFQHSKVAHCPFESFVCGLVLIAIVCSLSGADGVGANWCECAAFLGVACVDKRLDLQKVES